MKGRLYIVATPIGNLEDITQRAVRVLREVDVIACEDTRTTRKLLTYLGLDKPLTSYHDHNEEAKSKELITVLQAGSTIALVSDAGTPTISDPGYRIVSLAAQAGVEIIPIPGPSALIAALSVSGLPTSSFAYFGFLPKPGKKKREFLQALREYPHTLIFYESPHRVIDTLSTMYEIFGDRQCSVSREITKMFEETLREKISKAIELLEQKTVIKGEFVISVEGKNEVTVQSEEMIEQEIEHCKEKGMSLKDTASAVADKLSISRSKVYKIALELWGK